MKYYVSANAPFGGCGSAESPFRTINEAAQAALPGDEVIVAPGVYREYVDPAHGGTAENRIVYRSAEPLGAVITGAERIDTWENVGGDVWRARIPNGLFGAYNPYTTVIRGDWYWSPDDYHTGEVFFGGAAMYEALTLEDVRSPKASPYSWQPERSLYRWYTEQDGDKTVIYANFRGADPNRGDVEISVRRNCFAPSREGVGYITLSGFNIRRAATTWAPPTAFQDGMVAPHWSKGWIIEDCEISDSRCSGISLGKYLQPENENKWTTRFVKDGTQTERDAICQAQTEGWNKDSIGSHIIRRCHIHDCGQTGIVGHLGGVFSVIEDNHIHHINNKQDLAGAEIGGIKMHAAIDVIIRRNRIHNCTRGLWLDWQAQGTRVTQNLFYENMTPAGAAVGMDIALGEDMFVEVSHGPTLIDNNIFLSAFSCRLSTQGLAFVHNLIAGSFTYVGKGTDNGGTKLPTPRYTPYHMPHSTAVAGFMTILHGDARFYCNIFADRRAVPQSVTDYVRSEGLEAEYNTVVGTAAFEEYPTEEEYLAMFASGIPADRDCYYKKLPVWTGGNVYLGGARPCSKERGCAVSDAPVSIELVGDELVTDIFDSLPQAEPVRVTTETLGMAFEPEQRFEAPDGSPIAFDTDFFGAHRGAGTVPGPFAAPAGRIRVIK